jgi:hypothetical protein
MAVKIVPDFPVVLYCFVASYFHVVVWMQWILLTFYRDLGLIIMWFEKLSDL